MADKDAGTVGAEPIQGTARVTPEPIQGTARVTPEPAKMPTDLQPKAAPVTKANNTAEVIAKYAKGPASGQIIQDLSTGLKSLNGNVVLAGRAASQSQEAKAGALLALKDAIHTHETRFGRAVEHFGDSVAANIRDELIAVHNLTHISHEDAVKSLTPHSEEPTE